MGQLEQDVFQQIDGTFLCDRCTDDIFALCHNDLLESAILHDLNALYADILFTMESQQNDKVPLMDVNLKRDKSGASFNVRQHG